MLKHISNFKTFVKINESIRIEKIDPVSYERETVVSLPYLSYIRDNRHGFLQKLVKICKDLKINPLWLMHTMFNESRFDSKLADRISGGVGLISFLPSVIKSFLDTETGKNLTVNDVLQMSNVNQLDLVYSFYKSWFEVMKLKDNITPGDFAAITFYPTVIEKEMDWEFPSYVIEINGELFKEFKDGAKTKKAYYDYIEKILNNEEEFSDARENDSLLGNFTGAIIDAKTYMSTKKHLEYYRELILNIQDPVLSQVQPQDSENTEKQKQSE